MERLLGLRTRKPDPAREKPTLLILSGVVPGANPLNRNGTSQEALTITEIGVWKLLERISAGET